MYTDQLRSQLFTLTEDTISEPANVRGEDFQHTSLYVIATGATVDFSIRVKVSLQEDLPDFNDPSEEGNQWAYVQLKDVSTNAYYNGDTGYVFTTAETKEFECNTTGQAFYAVEMFDHADGSAQVRFFFKNNA